MGCEGVNVKEMLKLRNWRVESGEWRVGSGEWRIPSFFNLLWLVRNIWLQVALYVT